ncbi:hypothetical protein N7528_010260 [Penicillium herquei]|nr:hypothetical protein N7528_010260 [Penicillium herquei]
MTESNSSTKTTFVHADYTLAWICALPLELAAAEAMLDERHRTLPSRTTTQATYLLGKIAGHNVVLTCLPSGIYGITSAAVVVSQILSAFPNVRCGLMVGIGGGVPSLTADIRLGDVVVSKPTGTFGGVIQYDFGKTVRDGPIQRTGLLNQPPTILLTAVSQLEANQMMMKDEVILNRIYEIFRQHPNMKEAFSRPEEQDRLFQSTYDHSESEASCLKCDPREEVHRAPRASTEPKIHYGTIASGNHVIKDGRERDMIAQDFHAICFEMEAAGIMNHLPTLVIRGICDYCDSHKNKQWQKYAALVAALYSKLLLSVIPVEHRHRDGEMKLSIWIPHAVFWIPSTSIETVEQAFMSINKKLQLRNVTAGDVKSRVKAYLSSERAGQWLLIVDNADDTDMWTKPGTSPPLRNFLPTTQNGFILFTTRNQQLATRLVGPDVIRLSELNEAAALSLLQALLVEKDLTNDQESMVILVRQLHGLPLALNQAASFINENCISLKRYLSMLNKQETSMIELLSQDFEDDYRYPEIKNPIAATWFVSFQQIQKSSELAAEYLSFMACIDPRDIPLSLLPQHPSELECEKVMGMLKAYAFITTQTDNKFVSMHRLVHLAIRNWLRKEDQLEGWLLKAMDHFNRIFPSSEYENRSLWREYMPHAQFILQSRDISQGNLNKFQKLAEIVGDCLYHDGRYNEAGTILQEIYTARCGQCENGDGDEDILHILGQLSSTYRKQGRLKEAEVLGLQLMETRKRVLGLEHSDTLTSMKNLALTYCSQGRLREAEMLERRVMETVMMISGAGPGDPMIMSSMNSLASIYLLQGRWNEAEDLGMQAVEMRKMFLGIEHPDTLTSMGILTTIYWSQSRWREAEALGIQVVETRKTILGFEHPSTLISMANLAATYREQGRWDEAEALGVQVVETRKTVLGAEHPSTLVSMANLVTTYCHRGGRWKDAEGLFLQVIESQRDLLGPEHPDTLISMSNLASIYWNQGLLKEAEPLAVQVMETRKMVLGAQHPDTLTSMNNLACIWKSQYRLDKAIALLELCVQLQDRHFGPTHPATTNSISTLRSWKRAALGE